MSNDLISRSALLEEMKNVPPNAYTPGQMIYLAENAPTAYDVNKVIEKFEHKIMSVRNSVYTNDKLQNESIKTIIINIISDLEDVVKGGGIHE